MTRRAFASELEKAADQIADVSRADLQILPRRAALRLRNIEGLALDSDVDDAIGLLAAEMKLSRTEVPSDDHPRLADQRWPAAGRDTRRGE
jgi:hypothetical protein